VSRAGEDRGSAPLPRAKRLRPLGVALGLIIEVGRHTRSSIGVAELYADMPLEVEALFEIRD
jgi:hypothetical protein